MKKRIMPIVFMLVAVSSVAAQDTIYGRSPNYYYMDWYDECAEFYQPQDPNVRAQRTCFHRFNGGADLGFEGRLYNTTHRLSVKGLSAMVSIDLIHNCEIQCWDGDDSVVLPEYMYLFRHEEGNDTLILLDSVRWDTVAPKIMKLPKNYDTARGYLYCYAYEAMFKSTISVEGDFFIAGSCYSNVCSSSEGMHPPHKTVMYVTIHGGVRPPYPHGEAEAVTRCVYSVNPYRYHQFDYVNPWVLTQLDCTSYMEGYGPFHLIVVTDSSMLEVESADEEMGTVRGGGYLFDSTTYYIEAVPREGYKFTHWNDGDVTNPRAVYLTQDTLFTAYFARREQYEVLAVSDDLSRGSVYGGGTYYEEDTATLTARAWGANVFARWDDGDTANPRQVVVIQDTAFTALFHSREGIEDVQGATLSVRIEPNPTDGEVNVVMSEQQACTVRLTLQDAAGHEVLSTHIPAGETTARLSLGHLPSGSYYVTLHHPDGMATQKIVLK